MDTMEIEAKKIVKTLNRMCKMEIECYVCPMKELSNGTDCEIWFFKEPIKFVNILKTWAANNPAETNEQSFFKLIQDKPWQEYKKECYQNVNKPDSTRLCTHARPCSDCPWWHEESDFIE